MASSSKASIGTGSCPGREKVKPTLDRASVSLEAAKDFVQVLLKATHEDGQLKGIQSLREQIKSGGCDQFGVLIEAGVIPPLVRLLQSSSSRVQVNVSSVLLEICEGVRNHSVARVVSRAVPQLIKLLITTKNPKTADNCIGCLTEITFDLGNRKKVLQKGVIPPLVNWTNNWLNSPPEIVASPKSNPGLSQKAAIRKTLQLYYQLCEIVNPQPAHLKALAEFLPAHIRILSEIQDIIALETACDAIARFTCTDPNNSTAAVANVCLPISALLNHPKSSVAKSALAAIFNISAGGLDNVKEILKCGVLPKLARLLAGSPNDHAFLADIYRLIRNLCYYGTDGHMQQVVDAHLVPGLVQAAKEGPPKVMLEAVYTLYNLVQEGQGTLQQVEFLVERGALEALCEQLHVSVLSMDEEMVRRKLDVMTCILERVVCQSDKLSVWKKRVENCGGLRKILCLQNHWNLAIYRKALNLTEKYFGVELVLEIVG